MYVYCFGFGFISVVSGRNLNFSKAANAFPSACPTSSNCSLLFAKRRKEGKKEGRRKGREGERKRKKEMPSDTDPLGWPGTSIQWLQGVNAFCFKRIDVHSTSPNSVCTLESLLVESTHVGIGLESQ